MMRPRMILGGICASLLATALIASPFAATFITRAEKGAPLTSTDHDNNVAAVVEGFSGDSVWGGTSGGTAQAQTVTVALDGLTLRAGLTVEFIAGLNNTAANPTLRVNALTATTVKGPNAGNLQAGEISAGRIHTATYDGTQFRLRDSNIVLITQANYDAMFPVGFVQLRWDDTAPVMPSGVTATWSVITDTDRYLRFDSAGDAGQTGGSDVSALPNHVHPDGSYAVSGTTGTPTVNADGSDGSGRPSENHRHDFSASVIGESGNPTTNPNIAVAPRYRNVVGYRRTSWLAVELRLAA